MEDIAEKLFDAMTVLINKKIEAVRFDETKTAIIVDDNDADKGIYLVSEDHVNQYQAYSSVTDYKLNDSVLVTIPQGNYDNQKIIVGKAVSASDSPLIYTPPFASIVDVSNNLITTNLGECEMWANGDEYQWPIEELIFPADGNNNYQLNCIWDSKDSSQSYTDTQGFSHLNLNGYTRIGLQAQVATYLGEYSTVLGNYGLALELTFRTNELPEGQNSFVKYVTFDSDEYFGDVYRFDTYYTQETVYDITEYIDFAVDRIRLFMYQRVNFKDKYGNLILAPHDVDNDFSNIVPNIIFKDFYICVGVAADGFKDDDLTLTCNSSPDYYKHVQNVTMDMVANRDDYTNLSEAFEIINNHLDIIVLKEAYASIDKAALADTILTTSSPIALYEALAKIFKLQVPYDSMSASELAEYKTTYEVSATSQLNQLKKAYPAFTTLVTYLSSTVAREGYNLKEIEAVWLHKDVSTSIITKIERNEVPKDYSIQWYRYQIGAPSPDAWAGAHWVRFYGCKKTPDDSQEYCLTKEEVDADPDLDIATNQVYVDFMPNVNKEEEQIKAVIVYNESYNASGLPEIQRFITGSKPIIFSNKDDVRSQATVIDLNTLAIKIEDEEQGKYFLYNKSDQLNDDEANEIRVLTAVFDPNEPDVSKKALLVGEDCTSIKWTFPNSNTMIIPATDSTTSAIRSAATSFEGVTSVGYFINKKLDRYATNNTIQLSILKDGLTYDADVTLLFGTAGTSGSDYTLVMNWKNINQALDVTHPGWDTLMGEVGLQDRTGHYIPIPDESRIEYSWHVGEIAYAVSDGTYELVPDDRDMYYPIFSNISEAVFDDASLGNADLRKSDSTTYGGYYYYLDSGYVDVRTTLSQLLETNVSYSGGKFSSNGTITPDSNFTSTVAYFDIENKKFVPLMSLDASRCNIDDNGNFKVNNINIGQFYRKRKNEINLSNASQVSKDEKFFGDIYRVWANGQSSINNNANVEFFKSAEYWPQSNGRYIIQNQDNIANVVSPYFYENEEIISISEKFLKDLKAHRVNNSNLDSWISTFLSTASTLEFYNDKGMLDLAFSDDDGQLKAALLNVVFNIGNINEYMLNEFRERGDFTNIPSNSLNYFYYDTNSKIFKKVSSLGSNAAEEILIGKKEIYTIADYDNSKDYEFSKPQIEFKALTLIDDTLKLSYLQDPFGQTDLNTIESSERPSYHHSVFETVNNKKLFNYYNSNKAKPFIQIDGYYILDPYDEWREGEIYYEPIQVKQYACKIPPLRYTSSSIENTTTNSIIQIYPRAGLTTSALMNSLSILKVTLTNFGNYDLVAFFPIALRNGTEQSSYGQITKEAKYINGATEVRYTTGGTTDYNNNPYRIFIRTFSAGSGMQLEEPEENESQEENPSNYNWGILVPTHNLYDITTQNFIPTLSKRLLEPSPVFIPNLAGYGVQYKDNTGTVLWTQPILSYQDNYPSSTLNAWNGKDIITDNETGTIVSSAIAAGKKESDNTFTGVMLGDWSRSDTDAYIAKQTGLYGFNHGSMTYAFKDDGTGFIGKDGRGRIHFDGNRSEIYSSNWLGNVQAGMFLDVDDGVIKLNTEKSNFSVVENDEEVYYSNAQRYITLSSKEEKYPFSIGHKKYPGSRKFKVSWNGDATMYDATMHNATMELGTINEAVINDANIHEGTIDNAAITRGSIESARITEANIHEGTMDNAAITRGSIQYADLDEVNVRGNFNAITINATQSGNIAGWNITETALVNNSHTTILYGQITDPENQVGLVTNKIVVAAVNASDAEVGYHGSAGELGYIQGEDELGTTDLFGIDGILGSGVAIQSTGNIRLSANNSLYLGAGSNGPNIPTRIVVNGDDQHVTIVCNDFSIKTHTDEGDVDINPNNVHGVYARFA